MNYGFRYSAGGVVVWGCLYLMALLSLGGCGEEKKYSPPAAVKTQPYVITSDETFAPYKRVVEVDINNRLSESELRDIAIQIRDKNKKIEATLIGYRLRSEHSEIFWARSDFKPTLEIKFLRASPAQRSYLERTSFKVEGEFVAAWIDDSGYSIRKMVMHRVKNKVFISRFYMDGSSGSDAYTQKIEGNDIKLYPKDYAQKKEYLFIDQEKNLTFFDKGGRYMTLSPISN